MPSLRLTTEQKQLVAERARYRCEYCYSQIKYSPDPFSVDHITPRALGGTDEFDNLAYACLGCNNRKFTAEGATDPVTGGTCGFISSSSAQMGRALHLE